jgi:hypothetical protein
MQNKCTAGIYEKKTEFDCAFTKCSLREYKEQKYNQANVHVGRNMLGKCFQLYLDNT